MSETATFTGAGFKPFPNTIADCEQLHGVTEWSIERLENKMNEYGRFLEREDIMKRARILGGRILDHLIFEAACRDGVYDE